MTTAHVLRVSMEQRIRNQIGRVWRGTFGAEEGLCTLVRLAADEMRGSGAPRATIRRVLEQLVTDHPDVARALIAGDSEARARRLAASVVQWSDGTRVERASA